MGAQLIWSISGAQQLPHPRITGRVVALEEISAKGTRLTLAVSTGSGEERRQFLIAKNAVVTGFPMLGVQAEIGYFHSSPVDIATSIAYLLPPAAVPDELAAPEHGQQRHSGRTPLSGSQAAVSQNQTKPGQLAGASDGNGGGGKAVTSSKQAVCPTSGSVLSFTMTELKVLQGSAPNGELNFSLGPDTTIIGSVAPGEIVNVCYLIKNGRNVATTIIGWVPKSTRNRRVPEYTPPPDDWPNPELREPETERPMHGIREVSGKIVEVNGPVLTVEIPDVTEITVDEKTEIIGEIHQDVIAQIRYVVSCDDGVKVAIWVKVGAGR